MLHVIRDTQDPLISLIEDDPVRPEISAEDRVGPHKEILVRMVDGRPAAVVCVSYQDHVPEDVPGLVTTGAESVAVFYTIWSYDVGSGRQLVFEARDHVQETRPHVARFVTLSPPTEMARRFHLRNGAVELRINATTVNYEYR